MKEMQSWVEKKKKKKFFFFFLLNTKLKNE